MAQAHRYGLLVKGKEEVVVPLKNVSVTAQLKGSLVGLLSKFSYKNETADPLEVLFRFPVDESWAVVGLEAVIDGRRILAEVKEKEEAKEMYDDALASGLTAALGEEKSGDIFSLALGNLPPRWEWPVVLVSPLFLVLVFSVWSIECRPQLEQDNWKYEWESGSEWVGE